VNSGGLGKRRLLLFSAILIPGVVLIGLTVRIVRQERELVESRLADERRNATEQLRREFAARLDAIKLQEETRIAASTASLAAPFSDPSIVFLAPIERDHLILPWNREQAASLSSSVLSYQRAGENLEFRDRDLAAARNAYRYALSSADTPKGTCFARLWLGRVLLKLGNTGEATTVYRGMLKDCTDVVDEEAIGLGVYAAERLVTMNLDVQAGRGYALEEANKDRRRAPVEAYLMKAVLAGDSDRTAEIARNKLSAEIALGESILALASDIRVMGGLDVSFHASARTAWLSYGNEPWLLTIISPGSTAKSPLVLAVSPARLAPPEVRFLAANSPDGLPLGEGFTGLRVQWAEDRFTAPPVPVPLYAAGIAMILGFTALAAFLLLRDVSREVQIAQMRSQFVASVSHELKTPLTAIRMFAETLALGRTPDRSQTEYLQTIVSESERLSRLVDNVLDFSRIEQDRKIYQMQKVCLADVVRSALRAIQYPLARQNFTLNVAIDDSMPPMMADPDAIEQAVLNLLANAVKYSGAAREIRLQVRRDQDDAVIEVADNGVGIAPEHHHKIFEKFYRVRTAETDRVPGAGLGLTLVSHAIKAHGGRVEVSSTPGSGSTFSIRMPLSREARA
jgi:signal transduction histidine kinase